MLADECSPAEPDVAEAPLTRRHNLSDDGDAAAPLTIRTGDDGDSECACCHSMPKRKRADMPPCSVVPTAQPPLRLETLPSEVLFTILSMLYEFDLCRLSLVNKHFNALANSALLWERLYKTVFQYDVPLFYTGRGNLHFLQLSKWNHSNPWKASFEMLKNAVHVRRNFTFKTENSRSRRMTVLDNLSDAITFATANGISLIFLHADVYENQEIVINCNVEIVGASPGNVCESVKLVNTSTVVKFCKGAEDAYLCNVTVQLDAHPEGGGPYSSAIEVNEGCAPTIRNCVINSKHYTGAALTVSGKMANPRVENCKIVECCSVGICISDHAEGSYCNNEIARNMLAGVWVKKCATPVFKQCRIYGGNDVGIFVFEHGFGYFERCDIHTNRISAIEIKQGGNPLIFKCLIHDGLTGGVYVHDNGSGHIAHCHIYNNNFAGIWITMRSNPIIRKNRICNGRQGGVYIFNGGRGVIENNEIYGNALAGIQIRTDSEPVVRLNRIHHGQHGGIYVHERGKGIIENNEVYMNTLAGIWVTTDAAPCIRYNRIHSGRQVGVYFYDDGNGTLEENDIYNHQYSGIQIRTGSNPYVVRNKIWGGHNGGVLIYNGGRGILEENEIFGNAMAGVWIKTNSDPVLYRNKIFGSRHVGVCVFRNGNGTLEMNEIFGNAHTGVLISSGGNPLLRNNLIHDCHGSGVEITNDGRGTLIGNSIFCNRYSGISLATSVKPVLENNKVFDNHDLIEKTIQRGQCLYQVSSNVTFPMHDYYSCVTCLSSERKSICANCIQHCHAGHEVRFVRCDRFFCDCGAGTLEISCKLLQNSRQNDTVYDSADPTETVTSDE